MSEMVNALGIDRLTRDERLVLVQEIWDTIAAEQPPLILSDSQRQELERRVAEDEAASKEVIPWEQVKDEALARLRKP